MHTLAHPSLLLAVYRNYFIWLVIITVLQVFWSSAIFYFSIRPPVFLLIYSNPSFQPGVVYSIYSGLAAFYTLICIFLSRFLYSRGWFRAAAFASMVPGPGFCFGLFQLIPGWLIFRKLASHEWEQFFHWLDRTRPVNRLTSGGVSRLLPYWIRKGQRP